MKRIIEKLLWFPLLLLPTILVFGACEVDRSVLTEVEGDTTVVNVDYCDPDSVVYYDTAFVQDTLPAFQDTLPAFQDTLPSVQDTLPAYQDTLPAFQDTIIVYDTLAVVDTTEFIIWVQRTYCERRRGHSNNWVCEFPHD